MNIKIPIIASILAICSWNQKVLAQEIKYFDIDDTVFEVGAIYELQNVEWDFDASRLRPKSEVELNRVVQFLKTNNRLMVSFPTHTDYRGNDDYNTDLSERRSRSVVDYIASKGIDMFRLRPKGMGETMPYTVRQKDKDEHPFLHVGQLLHQGYKTTLESQEQQEICHWLNRRIEMKITHIIPKPEFVTINDAEVMAGNTQVIPDIRFHLGKKTIQSISFAQLDEILRFMEDNPNAVVEISQHLDCRVSSYSSRRLSQARAQSITEYLEDHGIPKQRMVPKGYEDTAPLTENGITYTCEYINKFETDQDKERLHKKNRRTEIKLLSNEFSYHNYGSIDPFVLDHFGTSVLHNKPQEINNLSQTKTDSIALEIFEYLESRPNAVIEIEVHTDCRGSFAANEELSAKRAKQIQISLIEMGIDQDRIFPVGKGETEPYVENQIELTCEFINNVNDRAGQEALHQKNQRVVVRVLSFNYKPKTPKRTHEVPFLLNE